MGGSWEAYRWEWAALSAISHFKNGELLEMRKVMKDVPTDLQPLPNEKSEWYFGLLELTVKYQPDDAIARVRVRLDLLQACLARLSRR